MQRNELKEQRRTIERNNGMIACLECNRFKRKCDKKLPCTPCVKRGLESFCPNLSTFTECPAPGKESSIEHERRRKLQERKCDVLASRIHTLEDALLLEAGDTHPLLAESRQADTSYYIHSESASKTSWMGHQMDAGTLLIKGRQAQTLLGGVAAEDLLMLDLFGAGTTEIGGLDSANVVMLTPEILLASNFFPFEPFFGRDTDCWRTLAHFLPSYERAVHLVDEYRRSLGRQVPPVTPSPPDNAFLPQFYPLNVPIQATKLQKCDLHELSVLFAILANGCANDLSQPQLNVEGESYFHLSRACLSFHTVLEHATFSAVQTMLILELYIKGVGRVRRSDAAWNWLHFGFQIAMSIGLHVDPSRWGLNPHHCNFHRVVFWEVFSADKWRSVVLGRPPYYPKGMVSCDLPHDGKEETVSTWLYRFCRDILAEMAELLCTVDSVPYSEILKFDGKLQAFTPHPWVFKAGSPNHALNDDERVDSKGRHPMITPFVKQRAIQILHRQFFARAMLDRTRSPFKSPYAPSVLATYRSAILLQGMFTAAVQMHRDYASRMHEMWSLSLICGIIIGSMACQRFSSEIADAALSELNKTIQLYEKVAKDHPTPKRGLAILNNLRAQAQELFGNTPSPASSSSHTSSSPAPSTPVTDSFDGLQIMAGTTRIHRANIDSSDAAKTPGRLEKTKEQQCNENLATEAEMSWSSIVARISAENWSL